MIFSSKGGVSPIIATVLLIAFAVALGAVVMNWGKGFVETTAKDAQDRSSLDMACQQNIELSVKEISNTPKICYNNTATPAYIEAILENSGTDDITGMQFVIFDSSDNMNISQNSSVSIVAGGVSNKLHIEHNLGAGVIQQIKFIPMVKPRGSSISQLCSKNGLVIDDISECSN